MPQTQTVVVKQLGNSLGTAGLIFSALGWLTCGLLCIPGALLSFGGLFSRGPKSTAIAGLIVGFPGVLFFAFIGAGLIAGTLGIGAAASGAIEQAKAEADRLRTEATTGPATPEPAAADPEQLIEPETVVADPAEGKPPAPEAEPASDAVLEAEPPAMPAAEPSEPNVRTFTDATGKHKVEAIVRGYKSGYVLLERPDGKRVSMPVGKLSPADREFLADNFEDGFLDD